MLKLRIPCTGKTLTYHVPLPVYNVHVLLQSDPTPCQTRGVNFKAGSETSCLCNKYTFSTVMIMIGTVTYGHISAFLALLVQDFHAFLSLSLRLICIFNCTKQNKSSEGCSKFNVQKHDMFRRKWYQHRNKCKSQNGKTRCLLSRKCTYNLCLLF